jgi:prepilin-type N-terminal cleavage/methylation domain-containing protein
MRKKKGFTLIEMLVVIAIVSILVAIVIPGVSNASKRARAATDAANLRVVLGLLNVDVIGDQKTVQEILDDSLNPTSKMDPDAVLYAVFETPGFIDVFYVNGDVYYGLDYLSDVATNGESSISTAKPTGDGYEWYEAGVGAFDD